MKKQLLATAIAGLFVVPAVAQVTISGNLDATATRSNKVSTLSGTTATQSNTTNTGGGGAPTAGGVATSTDGWSTSEMVFVATEDLGGGLKATARFSQALQSSAGVNQFNERDRVVDVSGGFGTVRLGRFTPAIGGLNSYSGAGTTAQGGDLDQMGSGSSKLFGNSAATATTAALTTGAANTASFNRQSGLIQFTSPSFNGITVNAAYGSNQTKTETATALVEGKLQSFGAAYTNGPLKVEFASGERKARTAGVAAIPGQAFFFNSTTNATSNDAAAQTLTQTTTKAAALGSAAIRADYASGTNVASGSSVTALGVVTTAGVLAVNALDATHDFDWLGASYNLGPATLMASHSRRQTSTNLTTTTVQATTVDAKVNSVGLMIPMGATTFRLSGYTGKDERGTANTDDVKLSGQQVSATYALSKRTFIYAVMGESEIKRDSASSTALERREKTNSLGLNHSF